MNPFAEGSDAQPLAVPICPQCGQRPREKSYTKGVRSTGYRPLCIICRRPDRALNARQRQRLRKRSNGKEGIEEHMGMDTPEPGTGRVPLRAIVTAESRDKLEGAAISSVINATDLSEMNWDVVRAYMKEVLPNEPGKMMDIVQDLVLLEGGGDWLTEQIEMSVHKLGLGTTVTYTGTRNVIAKGIIKDEDVEEPPEGNDELWPFVYPQSNLLLNGDTGAGKSAFGYNVALAAAHGMELWGFPFPKPMKILYFDPENSGRVRARRRKYLQALYGPSPNLDWHNSDGMDFSDVALLRHLADYINEHCIEWVFLDPIVNLFNVQNENDNAEAARHMKNYLSIVTNQTGVITWMFHHTGKENSGGNYGRGAAARLGASHLGVNMRLREDKDESDDSYRKEKQNFTADVVAVKGIKNRFGAKYSLYLRQGGNDLPYQFIPATHDEWMEKGVPTGKMSAKDKAKALVIDVLQDRYEMVPSKALVEEAISYPGAPGRNAFGEALRELALEGKIIAEKMSGVAGGAMQYRLPGTDPELIEAAEHDPEAE